jgi:hypothetical protein
MVINGWLKQSAPIVSAFTVQWKIESVYSITLSPSDNQCMKPDLYVMFPWLSIMHYAILALIQCSAITKFHENPSTGSRVTPYGRTDLTKLEASVRSFCDRGQKTCHTRITRLPHALILVKHV